MSLFLKTIQLSLLISLGLLSACSKPAVNQDLNLSPLESSDNIIGGQEVASLKDPVARTTVVLYDTAAKAICTGSLLGNNIVLTAAHCIGKKPQTTLVVFSQNLKTASREQTRSVVGAVTHPYWAKRQNEEKDEGDIALIKYSGTTPAGYASATLLPSLSYLQNRSFVLLAGYGISNGTSKEGAGVLRQVMTVIANSKFSTTEIQLEQRNGHGACHGDSGGPAFIVANGNYYLWGVTSRGYRDSEDNCSQFSIYTNALAYYQWIQTTARSLALAGSVFNYAPSERSFGQGTHY